MGESQWHPDLTPEEQAATKARQADSAMFSQGVSHRTDPHRADRVFHMLVRDDTAPTRWRTWCGYGLAREDTPGPYLGTTRSRLCSKCRGLAHDAVADGTMSESEAAPFAYEPSLSGE